MLKLFPPKGSPYGLPPDFFKLGTHRYDMPGGEGCRVTITNGQYIIAEASGPYSLRGQLVTSVLESVEEWIRLDGCE